MPAVTADYVVKQGDSQPVLTDTLTYSDESPVNLTGATVKFVMRSLTAPNPVALTGTTTVTDQLHGGVQYAPSAADTGTVGMYMANWLVTFQGGGQMTFPTVGYLWVSIEENLTTPGGQQLVSLPDLKDYLSIDHDDRAHDAKLLRWLAAVRPLVEKVTGPILPQVFEEWHDGGQYFIRLRRRPSTGYGTSPVLTLLGCDEYRGPSKYTLQIVPDPSQGGIYSCMLDPRLGTVTRRTSGGGVIAFPAQPQAVHVVYQAGQQTVPANVYEGTLELARVNYTRTQAVGRGRMAGADTEDVGPAMGYFVPRRVRELLAPNRKAPSIA